MQLASGSACQSLQPKYQEIAKIVFSNKYKPVIYTGSGSQDGSSRKYSIAVLKFSIFLPLFYLSPVISACYKCNSSVALKVADTAGFCNPKQTYLSYTR